MDLTRYDKLRSAIRRTLSPDEAAAADRALEYAAEHTASQVRHDGSPMLDHAAEVARIGLEEIGLGGDSVVAAILHDVVRTASRQDEETFLRLTDEIRDRFGKEVLGMTVSLSHISDIRLKASREQAENFRELIVSYSEDPRVILIKLADRLDVRTLDEIKIHLETYQKKYYDARHVCYAYMLGAARKDFRANDNGEPSGTAGKPILGQINSNELTDILIVVVRYFGGIKLGTSGLIVAYKAAAAEAIAAATIIEKTVDEDVTVMFEYPFMNDVMRIVKEEEPEILNQSYDMDCSMTLRIRRSMMPKLRARLEKVETARILDEENVL